MMDKELELLRAAALISMEEKNKKQAADELAALREAALDSARERKLSSDPSARRSVEGLGKRRLESPPSHHLPRRRSGGYESYSDSEESGNMTPKMSANDSIKHTPPRCDPVFTVKVTDHMLLKRNNKRSSSSHSNMSDHSTPHRPDDKITVELRNEKGSLSKSEEEQEENFEELEEGDQISDSKEDEIKIENSNHKSPLHLPPPKEPVLADVSPALSKVSSVEDLTRPPPTKKQKKKHKKRKSNSKTKKPKHKQKEPDSNSEDEKPAKKSNSNQKSEKREQNGASGRKEKLRAAEARLEKLQTEFKKQVISENIINKIDKNIEMLQNAKKHKQDNKSARPVAKKIISEDISSGEEEELLNEKKRSPKSRKDRSRRSKKSNSQTRSKSPASPVDVSVSLKSKREFEQMKAEMNKKATKSEKKEQNKSPRKEGRVRHSKDQPDLALKPEDRSKVNEKGNSKKFEPVSKSSDSASKPGGIKDINEEDELELLGEVPPKSAPLQPSQLQAPDPPDFVSVMREDSFSDSDQESDKVNITSDKKSSLDVKRKKSKKNKKKKAREEKSKRKKKRRKHSESSDSDDSDAHDRKKKVKIDKSELNKIVQFLKQRDEAQKAMDPKVPFNPKIINKETKPIEIKLKSKPKR